MKIIDNNVELKIMPITSDQPYTSRLSQFQLNNLILAYITAHFEENEAYTIKEGSIKKGENAIFFKEIASNGKPPIVVCQAVCDVKKYANYAGSAFINEVIQAFELNNLDQNQQQQKEQTWLIPLLQTRLWKKHCVLVEVTIKNHEKKIKIHDSQAWWKNLFYPNCLKALKKQGHQIKYIHHAKQADNYSCVFFVYEYIKEILKTGISDGLKTIFTSLNTLTGKDPIGKLIGSDFKRKYADIEVQNIQSEDMFSWKKEELSRQLNEDYYKQLKNLEVVLKTEDLEEDFIMYKLESEKTTGPHFFSPVSSLKEERSGQAQDLAFSR